MDSYSLEVAAVGDISLGDHPVCAGHGMRSTFRKKGGDVLRHVEPYLRKADIALGNLETVASDVGLNPHWLPSFEMRGSPDGLKHVRAAGIDLLGVANNHAMQHGSEAFHDCLKHLREEGFGIMGVDHEPGETTPFKFEHEGTTHTFFAISLRPEEWHDGPVPYSKRDNTEVLLAEVASLRANCEGFLICSIHWGLELLDHPGPQEVELGRALIDAGVDVVIGHHSHLLWPVERYGKGLIFYSLGNFVFDLWAEATKLSVIVKLNLQADQAPQYSLVPVVITDDFTLQPASGAAKEKILARMREGQTTPFLSDEEYRRSYNSAVKTAKPLKYKYFLKNFYKYTPNIFLQSLMRTMLRRLSGK